MADRGRSRVLGFALGLSLGLVGVAVLALLPDESTASAAPPAQVDHHTDLVALLARRASQAGSWPACC